MPNPRRIPHASEEGPTLLFQRGPLAFAERHAACPIRHVPNDMSDRPRTGLPAVILPLPPLRGPGAASPPGPTLTRPPAAGPSRPGEPTGPTLTRPPPRVARLPRPALLAPPDAEETLVLPAALEPAGPDAAAMARPIRMHPASPATAPASPDITMLQPQHLRSPTPRHRRPTRPALDTRAFFILNLCLGAMIVLGLLALATREVEPVPTFAPTRSTVHPDDR